MANSKQIVYLSQTQYNELISNGSITINGVTVNYNEDDIYLTPQAEPVIDVKVNGTSITNNGIANIPIASYNEFGVVKALDTISYGVRINSLGALDIYPITSEKVKEGRVNYLAINPQRQHESTFYGLTKAAGVDLASNANATVGTYPDSSKAAIQNLLGITDLLSTEETTTATAVHALNSTFMMDGKLHRATAAIAIGDAVEVGTNCEVVKADEVFVKNTDIASSSAYGVVKVKPGGGTNIDSVDKTIIINTANSNHIKTGTAIYMPIAPATQHEAVFYGLSKVAGIDLANETVTVGTYPETSKTAIRSLIGAAAASDVTVSDVQVNGTTVLNSGIANIPMANDSTIGVVKTSQTYGTGIYDGKLQIQSAPPSHYKAGEGNWRPITPAYQHQAAFYGLAKAAGADEKNSTLSVGTYTETAKSAIRGMLGAVSSNVVAVQDEMPTAADNKVWLPETEQEGIQVPTMEDLGDYVKKTDIATASTAGIVKVDNVNGIGIESGNKLYIEYAPSNLIKSGTGNYRPITPPRQHEAVFYGLATAAGDTTQKASENAVGTYTDGAKGAIQNMLGITSLLSTEEITTATAAHDLNSLFMMNGKLNRATAAISIGDAVTVGTNCEVVKADEVFVKKTDYATATTAGVIKKGYGLYIQDGALGVNTSYEADIKGGTASTFTNVNRQHIATFYGLAKAAGDSTQSASSNAVGTYTDEAKLAIQQMLGIDLSSIAAEVEIPLVETVSGTTPSIIGQPNTRYNCGEVSTISITPPAAGSIDVIFDSGSTAAVLTVPNTVRWPAWFDASSLEADTTYEILITDGVYGSVMTWAT